MDLFGGIILGFRVVLAPDTLLYCFLGVTLGTLIGVLPGIGPLPTIAMLLPITYYLDPIQSLIMLAGIYYGSQYGGSTTAILVNIPGESSSVVTCLDGYEMAKMGRAGPALGIAAIGSFLAGCFGTAALAVFSLPLSRMALKFTSPEYFSLMLLGLVCAVVLAQGSILKAIPMVLIGLVLGMVGIDVNSGMIRFAFGISELEDGVNFVVLAMGLFGVTEIIRNVELKEKRVAYTGKIKHVFPSRKDLRIAWKAIIRGTGLGMFFGILPGAGVSVSAFGSYALEKRLAKDPSRFGKGAIEGVAGPESANNAAAQTAFIPTLTLGIPGSATMAIMLGAMMIHGINPGPRVMVEFPKLFWGMIASMWVGNFMLVVLNLPLIGIWVKLLRIPYRLLYPAILLFACIGVFSLNGNPFDIISIAFFGLLGYIFMKLGCEPAPLLLAYILGPMMEENLRRSLLLSKGNPMIFISRPISMVFIVSTIALLLVPVLSEVRKKKRKHFGSYPKNSQNIEV